MTFCAAPQMSAFDPKRTCRGLWSHQPMVQRRSVSAGSRIGPVGRSAATPLADFEHRVVWFELEQVRHHRNHQRLRDRLIETDRNWPVQVSVLLDLEGHELVSRYLSHCPEDSLVQRGLASLGGHVGVYRPNRRKHVSSLFLEIFRGYESPYCNLFVTFTVT